MHIKKRWNYYSPLAKQKPCHRAINVQSRNFSVEPKIYCPFLLNYTTDYSRNSMSNYDINFGPFSYITHKILKIVLRYGFLRRR